MYFCGGVWSLVFGGLEIMSSNSKSCVEKFCYFVVWWGYKFFWCLVGDGGVRCVWLGYGGLYYCCDCLLVFDYLECGFYCSILRWDGDRVRKLLRFN